VPYYPIFLDVAGKPVVVIGAGKVALRKVKGLLEAGARVTVVAPRAEKEFGGLTVTMRRRSYRPSDITGATLIFTATDSRAVNHAVAARAKRLGIPVNVADAREECSFLVPARITRGSLQIAVSTGGESPRIAAALRRRIEEALDSAP
jgi:precorrin-2 dehydrogenase / sirohydrochlorin ferrochelatase